MNPQIITQRSQLAPHARQELRASPWQTSLQNLLPQRARTEHHCADPSGEVLHPSWHWRGPDDYQIDCLLSATQLVDPKGALDEAAWRYATQIGLNGKAHGPAPCSVLPNCSLWHQTQYLLSRRAM